MKKELLEEVKELLESGELTREEVLLVVYKRGRKLRFIMLRF